LGLGRVDDIRTHPRATRKLAWWVVLVTTLSALNFAGGKPPKNALYHWDNAIGSAALFLVILGVALAIARGMPELLALRRPRSWKGAAGGALVVLGSVYALTAIVAPILHPGREQGLTPDHWDSSRAAPFFANALVVCLIAPFAEEITFRGVGFGLLAARIGGERAVVTSGILFGLAHGLVQALPLLVAFGIGLAWLRERQGSTIPGMILHATFNGVALAASILA